MINLGKHKYEYFKVLESLSEIEDLTPEIIRDTLAPYKDDLLKDAENIAAYIEILKAEDVALKVARDEMDVIMDKKANKIARRIIYFTDYLINNLQELNINKVKGDLFDVAVRENPYKVNILNEDVIPKEYISIRTIEHSSYDKGLIREHILEGKLVEGAELVRTKKLVITAGE